MLDLAGWEMRPLSSEDAVIEEIPEDMVEKLAVYEHNNWVQERSSSGWMYAEVKNIEKKTSPYLVPYEDLTEDVKDLDRDIIRNIPELLSLIGMAVYVKKE
jgi:2-oxo-4-hydroxy-4-carboxy--5-ureidoimidazoline (OHCU) decarboxylase